MGVELYIYEELYPSEPLGSISVTLRKGWIGGAAVPGATASVTPDGSGSAWWFFGFPAPVALTVGSTYVIDVHTDTMRFGQPDLFDVYSRGGLGRLAVAPVGRRRNVFAGRGRVSREDSGQVAADA